MKSKAKSSWKFGGKKTRSWLASEQETEETNAVANPPYSEAESAILSAPPRVMPVPAQQVVNESINHPENHTVREIQTEIKIKELSERLNSVSDFPATVPDRPVEQPVWRPLDLDRHNLSDLPVRSDLARPEQDRLGRDHRDPVDRPVARPPFRTFSRQSERPPADAQAGDSTPAKPANPLSTGQAYPSEWKAPRLPNSFRSAAAAGQAAYTGSPAPLSSPAQKPVAEKSSGMARAMNAMKIALPVVQRLLPLLEGNVVKTVANFLSPQPPPAITPQPVNLAPVERVLTQLSTQQQELVGEIRAQNTSLKRVEDQLSHVQTATDRNTLEQQEMMQDLRAMAKRVNAFAMIVLVLLVLSAAVNVLLLLQQRHIIH